MKYVRISDSADVQALQFTGDNRDETRAIFGKPIVIRQGRFFDGTGYVVVGDWLVREAGGKVYAVKPEAFDAGYM